MSWNLGAGIDGQAAIVTGAGGAIGRRVVAGLDAAGARVLAVDLDENRAGAALDGLDRSRHAVYAGDLTDAAVRDRLIEQVIARFGGVHIVADLAAVARRRADLDDVTEEDWDLQHATNLRAPFFLLRAAAAVMRGQGQGGRLIAFTSQGWWTGGFGGSVVYAAAKGGIVSLVRGMARAYGPAGITVNAVAPGLVESPMLRIGTSEQAIDSLVAQTPLGRLAQPDDIAGVVVFLASEHARFISGATLNVSGAFLMY